MRSKNRNVKTMRAVGLAGALAVGLVAGGLLVEPVNAANGWEIPLNNYGESLSQSSVSITISGSGNEVLNADRGIAQGMIKRTASVAFGATDGYRVTVSGNPNLMGTNTKKTIPSAALTLSNMVNQWGWYAVNGAADCSASNVYKTMSTTGTQIDSGTLGASATKAYTMCFGMRVDTKQAADSYGGSVTVSAVAEPGTIRTGAFNGITYMQDMTANICANAKENETAQLIDRRDNKKYWVTKLLDGNCWMSQNLDFDIKKTGTIDYFNEPSNVTPTDSDVNSIWYTGGVSYPARPTTTYVTTGSATNTETYSWDLGNYVIKSPTATAACSSSSTGLSACADQFVAIGSRTPSTDPNFYQKNGATYTATEYDAHYLAGNYYQWNAATAGTGGTITNDNATGSVCPKGWRLPNMNGNSAKGSSYFLLRQYGVSSSVTGASSVNQNIYNIALSPLFFVRGGYIYAYNQQLSYAGQDGYYWSSRAGSGTDFAYNLHFDSSDVKPSGNGYRHSGQSLRCLVPTS